MLEYIWHGHTYWYPMFGRSNHRYSTFGVLLTVLAASTRLGNERSVKTKISRFVARGDFDGCSSFSTKLLTDL